MISERARIGQVGLTHQINERFHGRGEAHGGCLRSTPQRTSHSQQLGESKSPSSRSSNLTASPKSCDVSRENPMVGLVEF